MTETIAPAHPMHPNYDQSEATPLQKMKWLISCTEAVINMAPAALVRPTQVSIDVADDDPYVTTAGGYVDLRLDKGLPVSVLEGWARWLGGRVSVYNSEEGWNLASVKDGTFRGVPVRIVVHDAKVEAVAR